MRLALSGFVEGDLDEIASYIAQDNPRRAVTFIQDIRAKFQDIARSPLIYQLCGPTSATRHGWRPWATTPSCFVSSMTPCASSE